MTDIEMSLIIPAYNEAEAIPSLIARLQAIIDPLTIEYEVVIVDDGSTDNTGEVLNSVAAHNSKIVPIFLARNFGKESALAAGLSVAAGKCVAFLDADLQHPPELLREMYQHWKEGYDVIKATKHQRGDESLLYRFMAKLFNNMMSHAIGQDMTGASDFMLIDRQVADVILACPEKNRFFRGLIAWAGFNVKKIEFDVQEREFGTSKWSGTSLIRYSINNILSFSAMPLRIVGYVGIVTAVLGFLLLVQTLVRYAMGESAIGFTTVIAVQILLGGMILVALGVISIYLSGMYYEQKNRPLFIIKKPRSNYRKSSLYKGIEKTLHSKSVEIDPSRPAHLPEIQTVSSTDKKSNYVKAAVILILVSIGLHIPHFFSHTGDTNFDFFIHYNWAKEYSDNMTWNSLYPRWTFHGSLDLGEPAFIFYSPLYYMCTAMLTKLGLTTWLAMHCVEIISNAIFGWFVYKTTSYYTSNKIALFAGGIALVNPFLIMLHYKFNGFAWSSVGYASHGLLLWSLLRPNTDYNRINIAAGIAIAIAIYSHTISALVNLICFSAIVFYGNETRPISNWGAFTKRVAAWAGSVILGLGLSAYYLGPALLFMSNITTQAWSGDHILQAFSWPTFTVLLHGVQWFSFQWPIAIPALALFICNLVYFFKKSRHSTDIAYYQTQHPKLIAIMSIAVFFGSELSYPLWRIDSPLLKIQLPYRFLSVLYVVGIVGSCIALNDAIKNGYLFWKRIFLSVLLLTAATGTGTLIKATYLDGRALPVALKNNDYTYRAFEKIFKDSEDSDCDKHEQQHERKRCREISLEAGGYRGVPEYKLKWRGTDAKIYALRGLEGECESLGITCSLVREAGLEKIWQINTTKPVTLRLPVYHFQAWQVFLNDSPIDHKIDAKTGLIAISLPSGHNQVLIKWQETDIELYSKYISSLMLAILSWLLLSRRNERKIN